MRGQCKRYQFVIKKTRTRSTSWTQWTCSWYQSQVRTVRN